MTLWLQQHWAWRLEVHHTALQQCAVRCSMHFHLYVSNKGTLTVLPGTEGTAALVTTEQPCPSHQIDPLTEHAF